MKYYWIDLIDDFLLEKSWNEWLSKNTISTYISTFNVLLTCNYININNLSTFTSTNFKRFLLSSFEKYKWTSHTYNWRRKNLKVFCKYLLDKGLLDYNPIADIKIRKLEKSLPKFLTSKQINELVKTIDSVFNTSDFLTIRNKVIFYFYLYTWLRLNELLNLKYEDINLQDKTIRINKWKWNKDRIIPLLEILYIKLLPYLDLFDLNMKNGYLFPSRYGFILQKRDIYNIFKKVTCKLSFKLTPHMLRHTFATELVRKNVNIYNVSRILWHSNMKTTEIYLWLDLEELKCNLNRMQLFSVM